MIVRCAGGCVTRAPRSTRLLHRWRYRDLLQEQLCRALQLVRTPLVLVLSQGADFLHIDAQKSDNLLHCDQWIFWKSL